MMVRPMAIDRDFLSFFKMKMNSGNNFTGAVADSAHFILNETAVRTARIKDPIGKKFRLWNNGRHDHRHCERFSFFIAEK